MQKFGIIIIFQFCHFIDNLPVVKDLIVILPHPQWVKDGPWWMALLGIGGKQISYSISTAMLGRTEKNAVVFCHSSPPGTLPYFFSVRAVVPVVRVRKLAAKMHLMLAGSAFNRPAQYQNNNNNNTLHVYNRTQSTR